MHIAEEAQRRFQRRLMGVKLGGETQRPTAAVPAGPPADARGGVLDTLVDAGVARNRSEALARCVRLVGDGESAWIEKRGARCRRKARPTGPKAVAELTSAMMPAWASQASGRNGDPRP
jgi:hypothetical protein